jgi:hypothetical protein
MLLIICKPDSAYVKPMHSLKIIVALLSFEVAASHWVVFAIFKEKVAVKWVSKSYDISTSCSSLLPVLQGAQCEVVL